MKTLVYADLDKIVFEGRPQEYGAYQMRKRYNRYLQRAVLVTFLVFISLTLFPKIADWVIPESAVVEDNSLDNILITVAELPPPPALEEDVPEVTPPAPPEPPKVATVAFLIPEPVPDELVNDSATIAEVEALDSALIALVDQEGDDPGDFNYDFNNIGDGEPSDEVVVVEEKKGDDPGPGDWMDLDSEPSPVNMKELQDLIGYPAMAKEAEIEGKVILRVKIDKQGNYLSHIVLKDPHPILTNAVGKKINQIKMTPGIQAGKPVRVWVTIPFDFKLLR